MRFLQIPLDSQGDRRDSESVADPLGGWEGGGGRRGRVGSRRRAKANTQTQMAVLCRQ